MPPSELLKLLAVGDTVVAPATAFDVPREPRWSKAAFGVHWETAKVNGVVHSIRDDDVTVHWEDGDVCTLSITRLELTGGSLRRAEAQMALHLLSQQANEAGPSRPVVDRDLFGAVSDDDGSDLDAPLAKLGRTGADHREGSADLSEHSSEVREVDGSDVDFDPADDVPTAPSRGRGRGRSRLRGRGGKARGSARRRGSKKISTSPDCGELQLDSDEDTSSDDDVPGQVLHSNVGGDNNPRQITCGEYVWDTNRGRTVDPFAQRGYNRRAVFNLHNFTEKFELEFFEACFPSEMVPEIADMISKRGRDLGFGPTWEVSPGMAWLFLAYNFCVLAIHTGGPKEDLWLRPGDKKFEEAFYLCADLGQYGLQYSVFCKIMRCFELPTHGDWTDPFNPIRLFVEKWNSTMVAVLTPGSKVVVDESMGLWKGRRDKEGQMNGGMPGWMFVGRKPTNSGRESHTVADCDTGCCIFVEMYEGKTRMAKKEFVQEYGKNPAKALRCVKPWFNTGRLVILDAGFASVKCAIGMAEHGLYMIGNVKVGHTGFPKQWLLNKVPNKGDRVAALSTFTTSDGQEWSMLAAADKDKQPMALLGTAGTSTMGEPMVRRYTSLRADGTQGFIDRTLEQWQIHCVYRKNFNVIYMHNAKRQGGTSFEDTWKTKRWWLRDFQVLMGMSEVNAFLLWRMYRPGQATCDPDYFRRRLTFQMLRHPILMREKGEGMSLRGLTNECLHFLTENPRSPVGQARAMRRTCSFCHLKTQWSCNCSPWVEGMPTTLLGGVIFICSQAQNPECFLKHLQGHERISKRALGQAQAWVGRKKKVRGGGRIGNK